MQSYPSHHHSTDAKSFLGVNIAAGGNSDPQGDLKIALDTLFNHPNTAPFLSKQLIEHLVTSNPSPCLCGARGCGVRATMAREFGAT